VVQILKPTQKGNIDNADNVPMRESIITNDDTTCHVHDNDSITKNVEADLKGSIAQGKESITCSNADDSGPVISISTASPIAAESKSSTIQVLVSSNSNNPAALRSQTKSGAEHGSTPFLRDQTKFKSLGDLHMEKGLPTVPRIMPSNVSKTKMGNDDDEVSDAGSSNVARDKLASSAHKLLRSMKQLLAREKTVNITGTGSSSCSSQIAGEGKKSGVIITSSRTTENQINFQPNLNNKTQKHGNDIPKMMKSGKISSSNITKVNIGENEVVPRQDTTTTSGNNKPPQHINQAFPYDPRVNLQVLSTMSFPGLPSYPVLAASKSSPWNC